MSLEGDWKCGKHGVCVVVCVCEWGDHYMVAFVMVLSG